MREGTDVTQRAFAMDSFASNGILGDAFVIKGAGKEGI